MTEPRPAGGTTEGRRVDARHSGDWKSIGALHGSARGERNVTPSESLPCRALRL